VSLFVIAYDKSTQTLLSIDHFPASARRRADARRLELESAHRDRLLEVEVSMLEAPSQQALLKTHSRYFQSASQLARAQLLRPRKDRSKGSTSL
jgi:hypothetical protein